MSSEVQAKWMNSLTASSSGVAGDPLLEEVLHRLDVVVGGALDVLDPLGVRDLEVLDDGVEQVGGVARELRHLRDLRVAGQGLEPAHLHQDPVADQPVLAEDRPQVRGLGPVAAVHGGDGGEGGELHGRSPIALRCRAGRLACRRSRKAAPGRSRAQAAPGSVTPFAPPPGRGEAGRGVEVGSPAAAETASSLRPPPRPSPCPG